jgi:putative ubiquitin-RnfH superfamily antitoxin RatB of RatAB toxin-antitoxin module
VTPGARPAISVETVLQAAPAGAGAEPGFALVRQQHRIRAGTTIRGLLQAAGLDAAIAAVESGALGLSCHGKRAWLDDVPSDGSRVELVAPIRADAKAARAQRVADDRARRRTRFGQAG